MPRWPWAPTLARQVVGAAADQSVAWSATLSNANQQAIGTERREPGYSLGYCGPAPVPGQLTWNADPILAVCLLIIAALYAWRGRRLPGSRQLVFWCGWILLTLALISPLCNLSVALFSARIAQHVVLTTIPAPLLVLGDAGRIFRGKLGPMNVRGRTHATHQAVAVVVFALRLEQNSESLVIRSGGPFA
jgi:hypothetical protein